MKTVAGFEALNCALEWLVLKRPVTLWKFIKKDCLNGRYYSTHQQFQAAVLDSLDAINTRHQEALKTTLTLNFQMFDNVRLLAA